MGTREIDQLERRLLTFLAVMAALGALAAGWLVTDGLNKNGFVSTDYWKQVMTVMALSTLPLIVVAVQLPRLHGGGWAKVALVAVGLALLLIMSAVAVCMYEIGTAPKDPKDATWGAIAVATFGMTLTLAAIVVSAAATVLDKIDS